MKPVKLIFLLLLLNATTVQADATTEARPEAGAFAVIEDVVIIRPLSLAVTIAGTGLFLGLSPLTAFASIPAPHDAFPRVANILIAGPAAFTFVRPLGQFCISGQDRSWAYSCNW